MKEKSLIYTLILLVSIVFMFSCGDEDDQDPDQQEDEDEVRKTGTLSGIVINSITKEGIGGAEVVVIGESRRTQLTAPDGSYSFGFTYEGFDAYFDIEAKHPDFFDVSTIRVNFSNANDIRVPDFLLTPTPISLLSDQDGDSLIDLSFIEDLYLISLDRSLDTISSILGYELLNDLDFENPEHYKTDTLLSLLTQGEGWLPIGLQKDKSFSKVFEGNGFTVKNLFINRTTDYTALFGFTASTAEVRNVRVEIRSLIGDAYTAGLIGWNRGNVSNCSVSGVVQATDGTTGLLIGRHVEGLVTQCYSEGRITSDGSSVGGLIGDLGNSASGEPRVMFSYSSANVSGGNNVGGLIGYRYWGTPSIISCYATGNVTASAQAGGLAGKMSGTISSCYATGSITSDKWYVGGLVGEFFGTGSAITSSYSTGVVIATSDVGGLVGRGTGSIPSINYWDTETSGLETSAGNATGLTTASLQGITSNVSIYAVWSADAWDFGTATQYPALKGMPGGLEAQRP